MRILIVLFFLAVVLILGLAVTGIMAASDIWFFPVAPNMIVTVIATLGVAVNVMLIDHYEEWFIQHW